MTEIIEIFKENLLLAIGGGSVGVLTLLQLLKFMAKQSVNVVGKIVLKVIYNKTGLTKEQLENNLPGVFKLLTQFGGAYKEKIDFIFETLALSLPNKIDSPSYDEAQTERLRQLADKATELGATQLTQSIDTNIDPEVAQKLLELVGTMAKGVETNENR